MVKKLTLQLTGDQQKQIKDATGQNITTISVSVGGKGELNEKQLGQVVGGAVNAYLYFDSVSSSKT